MSWIAELFWHVYVTMNKEIHFRLDAKQQNSLENLRFLFPLSNFSYKKTVGGICKGEWVRGAGGLYQPLIPSFMGLYSKKIWKLIRKYIFLLVIYLVP